MAVRAVVYLFALCAVFPTNAFAQTCVAPPSGIVAWWPGDGNAIDIAGGNNGQPLGGVTFEPGMVGLGFRFHGIAESVRVPSGANLRLGAGEMTLAAWINRPPQGSSNPLSGGSTIISKASIIFPNQQYSLQTFLNQARFLATDCGTGSCGFGGPTKNAVYSGSTVADGKFHHVAGVRRANGVLEIWVDGVLDNTRTEPMWNTDSDAPLYIGDLAGIAENRYTFPGIIDEVQIYNRALSREELQAIYHAGSAGHCKPSNVSIVPSKGGNAGRVTASIYGASAQDGVEVKLTGSGWPDIIGQSTAVPYPGVITTIFDLTGVPPGPRNVVVTNPDNTSAALPNGFAVEQGGAADLWVEIVGLDKIRIGSKQRYYVTYGNRGNTDSSPSLISVVPSSSLTATPDDDGRFIGSINSTIGNALAFGVVSVPAGGSDALGLTLQTIPFSLSSRAPLVAPAASSSPYQMSAFLNLLLDLPPSTGADFDSVLQQTGGCSFFAVCDSQCASQYLRQLQFRDLARSQFDVYTNSSAAATASFAQAFAKRALAGAKAAFISHTIGTLVGFIGLESAGGRAGRVAEEFVSSALEHIVSATEDAYTGAQTTNQQELHKAGLDLASAATNAATLEMLLRTAPAQARVLAGQVSVGVAFISGALDGMAADFNEYFDHKVQRQNAWENFRVSAANFCRARNDVEACHAGLGSTATPCGSPPQPPPPEDTGDDRSTLNLEGVLAIDPNDKVGAQGATPQRYLSGGQPIPYSIYFENLPTATAPAQTVVITDTLNANAFDLSTIALGPINFVDKLVTPPSMPLALLGTYTTDVDLRPGNNLILRVTAALNATTGVLKWTFTSLEPITRQPPADPLAGFLPPGAEGSVLFTVAPKAPVTTGTQITNKAAIVFDVNPPIDTPVWVNTIDNSKPTSSVNPLATTQAITDFTVSWAGSDLGAGIRNYTVYVSDNNGPFTVWQTPTAATQATFSGINGHTYRFYSLARDLVGNVEDAKTTAEASTRVLLPFVNVAEDVTVTTSPFSQGRDRGIATWTAVLTITNTSSPPSRASRAGGIPGPLYVVLTNLSTNATMLNNSGMYNGSPYITIPIGALTPGNSASVLIEFANSTGGPITFIPVTYSGGQ